MNTTVLKPGWIVKLSTEINGNTKYDKVDLEANSPGDNGQLISRWETTRTIVDPAEAERATKLRSKCRSIIISVCSESSKFGLLCPSEKKPQLDIAVEQAQALARAFNTSARCTSIEINVLCGSIAPSDAQATRSIRNEVRGMIETMHKGVLELNVESIRDAATKAKAICGILEPDTSNLVLTALNAARDAARQIRKATRETGRATPDRNAVRILRASRMSFLDLDDSDGTNSAPKFIPQSSARTIELDWNPAVVDSLDSNAVGI